MVSGQIDGVVETGGVHVPLPECDNQAGNGDANRFAELTVGHPLE
jgi:hypothetical protein